MSFAFQFPGQGSQSVGMLSELAAVQPEIRRSFEEAGEALGEDLWNLVSRGPAEDLDRTEQTQPALLAAGIACWRVWQARGGLQPDFLAGHSLGEYTALVAADVLDFADAIRLVRRRAQLMQAAVPEGQGGMAAIIGLDDQTVRDLCGRLAVEDGGVLQAVNFNAPGQVVIAGDSALLDRAMQCAGEEGARMVKKLPISVPCHSDLLQDAASELAGSLQETPMRAPRIPVIHNIDAQPRHELEDIRRAMARQLYSPVLWTDCVQRLQKENVTLLVECGPGRVLSGLARRIDRNLGCASLHDSDSIDQALPMAQEAQT